MTPLQRANEARSIRARERRINARAKFGIDHKNGHSPWLRAASKTWCQFHKVNAPHQAVESGKADILEWCAHLEHWRHR